MAGVSLRGILCEPRGFPTSPPEDARSVISQGRGGHTLAKGERVYIDASLLCGRLFPAVRRFSRDSSFTSSDEVSCTAHQLWVWAPEWGRGGPLALTGLTDPDSRSAGSAAPGPGHSCSPALPIGPLLQCLSPALQGGGIWSQHLF